ncbi:MAG: YigZ family protein [Bacilli bacterium]|nr:YigZ family protein [Bacilli bacterium]
MRTIKNNKEIEIIINKSRFICISYIINSISDVDVFLNETKEKYEGATHYCYAYIIDSYKKCSDDKEPSGTAGLPILNVLEKNELNNILVIVVRYFGGIKLGAGGLVRAYTNSVVECIKDNIKDIKKGIKLEIKFGYDKVKIIDNIFKDKIIDKYFDEYIMYIIKISYDEYELIKNKLINLNVKVLEDNIII